MTAPNDSAPPDVPAPTRRRPPYWILLLLLLMVLMPFLFWHGTWFGRPLSEEETGEYLSDTERPRRTQHALVQIGERLERGDPSVTRWYPRILELAEHRRPEIRSTVAWLMGHDTASKEFHSALHELLHDPHPVVRQNAALSLVRFGDARGRPVLRQMLLPYPATAPAAGTLEIRLQPTSSVNAGTLLGRIHTTEEESAELRSPMAGRVRRWMVSGGSRVSAGDPVVMLSPDEAQVWEALRALLLVGEAEDLELVEPYVRGAPDMSERIERQAALTTEAIRKRTTRQEESPPEQGSG